MSILKQIKWWILHWIWFLIILWLVWAVYAFTTPLPQVNTWNPLTAQWWNDMVDAVNDEYSTTETLTNRTWLGKSVYRKIIISDSIANNTIWNTNKPHLVTGIDEIIRADLIFIWANDGYSSSYTYVDWGVRIAASANYTDFHFHINSSWSANYTFYGVMEYTKN